MEKTKIIVWRKKALEEFADIISYIAERSERGASIVEQSILNKITPLPTNPEMYAADELKSDNDGSYRAFTVFHYRVSYKIDSDRIYILRVRHTSREPLEY